MQIWHVLLKFKWVYWVGGNARSRGLLGWSMVRGQGRYTKLKFHNSTRSPSLGQASGHKVEYHSKHIFLPKLGQICALKKQVSARVPHCCLGTRSAANLCPQTKIIYFDFKLLFPFWFWQISKDNLNLNTIQRIPVSFQIGGGHIRCWLS